MEIYFNNPLLQDSQKLILKRYPETRDDNLRAWDAADELILQDLKERELSKKKILIINDSFGALTCGLSQYDRTSYIDSYVSQKGIVKNLTENKLEQCQLINDLELLDPNVKYDYILIKLPKSLSFLEDILCQLQRVMHEHSLAIFAGMIKHMPKSNFDLIQKYLGETTTSLAKKKARLIYARKEVVDQSQYKPKDLHVQGLESPLTNLSNLFSRDKLDIGTRFFIENLPKDQQGPILDLGCANGIVGIMAKKLNPTAQIIFVDDSYMAIKSARINYQKFFDDEAQFIWMNCYEQEDLPKVQVVLCNPPFHQGNTIGDFIAWQMFHDAKRALTPEGLIRVIGNRHLGYHVKLKKIFKNSNVLNQNKKFVIIDSYKN